MPTTPRRGLPRPFILVCAAVGVVGVLYFALWFVAATVRQSKETVTTYGGVDQLRIDGSAGDIKLIAEDRDDVRVVAHTTWALAEPAHSQQLAGGVLRLSGSCGFWGSFGPEGCSTDFEIHVPRDMPIDAHVSAGDVSATGLTGPVKLGVSSGDVHADQLAGDLRIRSSSGDVTVTGYGGRDVDAGTSSGDVEVRARLAPDRLKAVTSSGDVTVAVSGSERYRVQADTGSGDQEVQVDQSLDAPRTIDARTSSGDIRVVRVDDAR